MNSVVIYASRFGNTQRIAAAIADGLRASGPVQVVAAEEAPATFPAGTDLVVIGGPTEQHRMTEPVARLFDRMASAALSGIAAAAFDTRLRWPRWLSGSAAADIAEMLHQAGARVIAPPESFYIKGAAGTGGHNTAKLDAGELERAASWGAALAAALTHRPAANAPAVG
jgi:flavodoxin